MAQKEVTLIRSFAFQDEEGKQHYFTRDNQDKILEIVGEGNLQQYIDSGTIEVYDGSEVVPKTPAPKAEAPRRGISPAATTAAPRPATRKEG